MRAYIFSVWIASLVSLGSPANASVIYDESIDGPLPYTLSNLTYEELQPYTLNVNAGTNTILGTSTSGENLLFEIGHGLYLESVSVSFFTHIDRNDHILDIDEIYSDIDPQNPYLYSLRSIVWNVFPMPFVGTYEYLIDLSEQNVGPGLYELYSGTSVQGASNENPYSISLEVRTIPLSPPIVYIGIGLIGLMLISRKHGSLVIHPKR